MKLTQSLALFFFITIKHLIQDLER